MADGRSKLALSEPVAAVSLMVTAAACAGLLFTQQRSVSPLELPSLSLPERDVEKALHADAAAARAAPSGARAKALQALLYEQGVAEARGLEDLELYRDRRRALSHGYQQLAAEVGETKALRLRAKNALELEAALELRLPDERAEAVLGALPAILAREGASRDGELTAARFVVHTLFKSRWNLLHGLAPAHGFSRIERRAYYGWQALHAERVALPRRIEALTAYAQAGGTRVSEALGALLFRHGDYAQAARALEAAHREQGSLRTRSALLAARAAAAR